MNTTTNYELSQWEDSDRVMRTDFNDNNAKIDAALKAISDLATAAAYRKLKNITTTVSATQIDIDMTDVDLDEYNKLDIFMHCSASTIGGNLYIRVNGLTTGYYKGGNITDCLVFAHTESDRDGFRGATCAEIFIGSAIVGRCCTVNQETESVPSFPFSLLLPSTCAPSNVTALNLLTSGTSSAIGAGSRIEIYGVKR